MAKQKMFFRSNVQIDEAERLGIVVPQLPAETWLSPNEIGKLLNVTGEAVKVWISKRKLPAIKQDNGYWRVNAADLTKFLERRQHPKHRLLIYDPGTTSMRDIVNHLGTLSDFEVVTSTSHTDALMKAGTSVPGLALVNLAGTKGHRPWDFVIHLRSFRQATRRAGLLLVADRDLTPEEADRAVECGAHGFLRLPCTPAFAGAEIRRIVAG